jgi:hypothetical protein
MDDFPLQSRKLHPLDLNFWLSKIFYYKPCRNKSHVRWLKLCLGCWVRAWEGLKSALTGNGKSSNIFSDYLFSLWPFVIYWFSAELLSLSLFFALNSLITFSEFFFFFEKKKNEIDYFASKFYCKEMQFDQVVLYHKSKFNFPVKESKKIRSKNHSQIL